MTLFVVDGVRLRLVGEWPFPATFRGVRGSEAALFPGDSSKGFKIFAVYSGLSKTEPALSFDHDGVLIPLASLFYSPSLTVRLINRSSRPVDVLLLWAIFV